MKFSETPYQPPPCLLQMAVFAHICMWNVYLELRAADLHGNPTSKHSILREHEPDLDTSQLQVGDNFIFTLVNIQSL